MKRIGNNYKNIVESLMCLFTADEGDLKILLVRKKTDPYKGYWCLPNDTVSIEETIEENVLSMMEKQYQYTNFFMKQSGVFSRLDRDPENRIIGISFLGLIDNVHALILHPEIEDIDEVSWFPIRELPKIGYDHDEIIKEAISNMKSELLNVDMLMKLIPGDFTLPEMQKIYEQILGHSLDKRNFRKKFLNLGVIEETGEKTEGQGRPAAFYRFKENAKQEDLF